MRDMLMKKYQIFISSTYEDLKEERRFVRNAILKIRQFPIGMEDFSASDRRQWDIIKSEIDTSDYCVLIIGKRYGTIDEMGISYTEKEFDYATEAGVPVIAFIKSDNARYVPAEIDVESEKVDKLKRFTKKVMANRVVEWFDNSYDLSAKVIAALHKEIEKGDRPGWVRGTSSAINKGYDSGIYEYDDLFEEIEEYDFSYSQYPSDGRHRMLGYRGEVLEEGEYKDGELVKGTEYNMLVRIDEGKLIYRPNSLDDPYEVEGEFRYSKLEPYGGDLFSPFSMSEVYIENEGFENYYVTDFEIDKNREQMTNIRTLVEFLENKDKDTLERLRTLYAIEHEI